MGKDALQLEKKRADEGGGSYKKHVQNGVASAIGKTGRECRNNDGARSILDDRNLSFSMEPVAFLPVAAAAGPVRQETLFEAVCSDLLHSSHHIP
jgi:hypothetical protein